jgi:hypothetical protein
MGRRLQESARRRLQATIAEAANYELGEMAFEVVVLMRYFVDKGLLEEENARLLTNYNNVMTQHAMARALGRPAPGIYGSAHELIDFVLRVAYDKWLRRLETNWREEETFAAFSHRHRTAIRTADHNGLIEHGTLRFWIPRQF